MNVNLSMVPVSILVEGIIDATVAKCILKHVGLVAGKAYGQKGKADLLKRLTGCNQSAQFLPWFVIVDLDNDAVCASQAIELWLPRCEVGLRFRVAVRAIEAWIMADIENLARFLAVSPSRLPYNPDLDPHPKETLVNLARTSKDRHIREGMVPPQGSNFSVGPAYTVRLDEFIINHWQPEEAAKRSRSLRHCIDALFTLKTWNVLGSQ